MSVFFKILEDNILVMLIAQTQAKLCLKVIFINYKGSVIMLVLYTKHRKAHLAPLTSRPDVFSLFFSVNVFCCFLLLFFSFLFRLCISIDSLPCFTTAIYSVVEMLDYNIPYIKL